MSECPNFEHLLIVPRLRVQNANAISSPLTHGFPSITAFIGLMWALERKTRAAGLDLHFKAVGVVCHAQQEQITESGFVKAFRLTRNPIRKDGGTAAIVEEGRIHLDISLVFAVQSKTLSTAALSNDAAPDQIAAQVGDLIAQMRIAGGSVISPVVASHRRKPHVVAMTGTEQDQAQLFLRAKLHLLPGFALVSRDDLLDERHRALVAENPASTRLDAWLSLSRINWRYEDGSESGAAPKAQWQHDRKGLGWIVPIPVGYGALSGPHPAGSVANARDGDTPFCFVESLYSVGQWLSPHRLQSPQHLLWYADSQPDEGLYCCRNDYHTPQIHDYDFE